MILSTSPPLQQSIHRHLGTVRITLRSGSIYAGVSLPVEISVAITSKRYYGSNNPGERTDPMADRYKVDCRKYPSDQGCTVTIAGSIDEVVKRDGFTPRCTMVTKTRKKKN
jgi:hypothetical protein